MASEASKTVVLGLGNVLHADDGAGAQVIKRLREDTRVPADVDLVEGGTLGLELLPYVWDCARLIVIDAVDVGRPAGTVVRMTREELNSLPGNSSVHQLGVSDLLVALRILAQKQPEVTLLGVQPASTEWSTELTPAVATALGTLVEAAVRELCSQRQTEPAA
jgi:hydrogenase maturation protease